jgi:hypothetical protein
VTAKLRNITENMTEIEKQFCRLTQIGPKIETIRKELMGAIHHSESNEGAFDDPLRYHSASFEGQ